MLLRSAMTSARRRLLPLPLIALLGAIPLFGAIALLACGERDADGDGVLADDRCPSSPPGFAADAAGCTLPERALARGIETIVARAPICQVGTLWALRRVEALGAPTELSQWIDASAQLCDGATGVALVAPGAPRTLLPEDPGKGAMRIATYVRAPMGRPEDRARRYVAEFLAMRETRGYLLTHQLLVLLWADEMGLELPDDLQARREPLLARIAAEQEEAGRFDDLFAERLAILLHTGAVDAEAARPWIVQLLGAQGPDGAWQEPEPEREALIDGEVFQAKIGTPPHADGLSLMALATWLDRVR